MSEHAHEPYDQSVRVVLWICGALVLLVALSMAAVALQWSWLRAASTAADRVPPPLAAERAPPPPPRLQESPRMDMQQMRAREDAVLNGYGWVDRDQGVVRIPIERAMELEATK